MAYRRRVDEFEVIGEDIAADANVVTAVVVGEDGISRVATVMVDMVVGEEREGEGGILATSFYEVLRMTGHYAMMAVCVLVALVAIGLVFRALVNNLRAIKDEFIFRFGSVEVAVRRPGEGRALLRKKQF